MASRKSRRRKRKAAGRRKAAARAVQQQAVSEAPPSPTAGRAASSVRQIILFCVLFAVYLTALFYVLQNRFVILGFIEPHTAVIARISDRIFNLLGTRTVAAGTIVRAQSFAIDIRNNCNGVFVSAIYLAAVLAYPASWKSRGWGIIMGIPIIYLINLARVVTLFYVGIYFPRFFDKTHVLIWQSLVIFFALLVWIFWVERFTGAPAGEKNMVRG
jgi:exosortase H (IPTLxxWG-CTERM-specific)